MTQYCCVVCCVTHIIKIIILQGMTPYDIAERQKSRLNERSWKFNNCRDIGNYLTVYMIFVLRIIILVLELITLIIFSIDFIVSH